MSRRDEPARQPRPAPICRSDPTAPSTSSAPRPRRAGIGRCRPSPRSTLRRRRSGGTGSSGQLSSALFLAIGVAAAPHAYAQAKKDTAPAPAKTDAKPAATPEGKKALLDINSASADELKALPGVGDAYSKKIIDNRPYAKKDQLVSRKVIPEKTYQGIKDMIIAKQK